MACSHNESPAVASHSNAGGLIRIATGLAAELDAKEVFSAAIVPGVGLAITAD
jgi:hypothetical protein